MRFISIGYRFSRKTGGKGKHSLFKRDRADGFVMVLKDYLNNSVEHFPCNAFLKAVSKA